MRTHSWQVGTVNFVRGPMSSSGTVPHSTRCAVPCSSTSTACVVLSSTKRERVSTMISPRRRLASSAKLMRNKVTPPGNWATDLERRWAPGACREGGASGTPSGRHGATQ